MGERLFDVYVFARSQTFDCCQSMPMVGCSDRDCVQVFVLQHGAKVLNKLRSIADGFFDLERGGLSDLAVYIADIGDATVLQLRKCVDVFLAMASRAHDSDSDEGFAVVAFRLGCWFVAQVYDCLAEVSNVGVKRCDVGV